MTQFEAVGVSEKASYPPSEKSAARASRYDTFGQTNNSCITPENYGGAKDLELLPAERVEVILVAPPADIVHCQKNG